MKFDTLYKKYLSESNYSGSGGAFGDTSGDYNPGDHRPIAASDIVLGSTPKRKTKRKKKKKVEEDQIAIAKGPVSTRPPIERVLGVA
jgi:hypothetical protein